MKVAGVEKCNVGDFGEIEKLQVKKKGPSDFVTNADLKAEKIIIDEFTDISYNTNYYRILLFLPYSK